MPAIILRAKFSRFRIKVIKLFYVFNFILKNSPAVLFAILFFNLTIFNYLCGSKTVMHIL